MNMADNGSKSGDGTDEVNQVSGAEDRTPNTVTDLSQDANFAEARNATETFLTIARKLIDAWEIGEIGEQELIAGVARQLIPDLRADELDPRFHITDNHVHKVQESYIRAQKGVAIFEEQFGPINPSQDAPVEGPAWLRREFRKRFPTLAEPITADQAQTIMSQASGERSHVIDALDIAENVHRGRRPVYSPIGFVISLLAKQPQEKLTREAAEIRRRRNTPQDNS